MFGKVKRTGSSDTKYAIIVDRAAPYVFIAPAMIFILLLSVFPILYSFGISLTRYNLFLPSSAIKFIGLKNYVNIIQNSDFLQSIVWTFTFAISVVSINIVLSMILALALNNKLMEKQTAVFKTLFIMPMMIAPVVIATMWRMMFTPDYGVINNILSIFNIEPVNWLQATIPGKAAIIIVDAWGSTPFCMIIFLAALNTVPVELYEAATIDGASKVKMFFNITLPKIRNFIALVVTIRIMDSLRMFDIVYNLTNGGPGTSTETMGTIIYKTAFKYSNVGAGSAGAFIFFIMIAIVSLLMMVILRKESEV